MVRQDTAVFYIEVHGLVSIVTDFKALFVAIKAGAHRICCTISSTSSLPVCPRC